VWLFGFGLCLTHPLIPSTYDEDYELRDWSKKFGATPEQLKAAVKKVGVMAADVEKELKKA
jgi:hypothetical protein